jgi:methionyl-tRNA formyltransferase
VKTIYLGTSEFAAVVLRRLAASQHRPALIVTPPDRPRGRGRRVQSPPVADAGRELGIEVLQSSNVNSREIRQPIDGAAPEAIAVCAFGQLIREPLLSERLLLNIHPSLLPRWRGAAPIERAIMAGDAVTGVSVMRVTAGLDSGPVALREEEPIRGEDDFASLSERLAERGGSLLVRALDLHEAGRLELVEQEEATATYAPKIEAAERRLDTGRPAAELARTIRALTPHVGAYLELADGGRLGVRQAREVEADLPAGELHARDGNLLLGCGSGALRLEVVQPEGGKPMQADAYMRGHRLPSPRSR